MTPTTLSPIPPNELRLGNWVSNIATGEFAYQIKSGSEIKEGYWPIPLTEGMLKEAGFFPKDHVGGRGCTWESETSNVKFEWNPYDGFYFEYNEWDSQANVTYVHHLQNLHHALTGSELPLTLTPPDFSQAVDETER